VILSSEQVDQLIKSLFEDHVQAIGGIRLRRSQIQAPLITRRKSRIGQKHLRS